MKLKIMTPERVVFEGMVDEVYLPGRDGEFGILPEHAELIAELGTGIARFVTGPEKKTERLLLSIGTCHVRENDIAVLVTLSEKPGNIDTAGAKERLKAIENTLATSELTEEKRYLLETERARELSRLELAAS